MEFKETISEEAFYKRVFKKSNSQDSMTQAKVAVSNIRYYCRDLFSEDEQTVLTKLKQQDSVALIDRIIKCTHEKVQIAHVVLGVKEILKEGKKRLN